jgi:hypothetical protein
MVAQTKRRRKILENLIQEKHLQSVFHGRGIGRSIRKTEASQTDVSAVNTPSYFLPLVP